MHLGPEYNFSIKINSELYDNAHEERLHEGILYLQMNYVISISLIPEIKVWPPVFPKEFKTNQDIRNELLLHSTYAISPCNNRANELEFISENYLEEQLTVGKVIQPLYIFFVSEKDFKKYSEEANRLWNEIERIGGDTSFEKMKKQFDVVKFIEEQIINSPYLTDRELNAIGRMRDAEGNVVPDPQYLY